MGEQRDLFELAALLILPFRASVEEFDISGQLPNDDWVTGFKLYYRDTVSWSSFRREGQPRVAVSGGVVSAIDRPPLPLNTTWCTFIEVQTKFPFTGTQAEAESWVRDHAAGIVSDSIIPRVNQLTLGLKRTAPDLLITGTLRTVGDMDLAFVNLAFEGKVIFSRGTSTFIYGIGTSLRRTVVIVDLTKPVAKEKAVLIRSAELVNHGYFVEAFVVAFALLDHVVRRFVEERLPNLRVEEAKELLQRIESQRLQTYLGSLTRLICGRSPLDSKALNDDLKWLNQKRNAVMHEGYECTRREAQRGLEVVMCILHALKELGAQLDIPQALEFWVGDH